MSSNFPYRILLLVVTLVCGVVLSTTATAQEVELVAPEARQGYYITGTIDAAVNANDSDEEETGTLVGTAFSLRLGEMITDWIGAGVRVGGGFMGNDEWEAGFGGLQLELQVVPVSDLAVVVGIGAGGLSVSEIDPAPGEEDELKGTGGAYYSVAVSYDLFPLYDKGSGGFALAPAVRMTYLPGEIFEGYIVTAGLEVTWWTGLDKNKLDLPLDEAFEKE